MTCLEQWQWGSVQVEGKCNVQNPCFGNSCQGLGFEGQAAPCSGTAVLSWSDISLSLSQHCAQIPGLVGTQGFSLLHPHIVRLCSWLPVEVPAGAVIFHFITMSLMFSRHLSCCLCLLFGCIPPLCWSGEHLHLVLLGALACSHLSSRSLTPGCLPCKLCGCRLGRARGFCHKTTPGCEQK